MRKKIKRLLMFTLHQIMEAHAQVGSGADFPTYVQALIGLGVAGYSTYVRDGHTEYYGRDGYRVESESKYAPQQVAETGDPESFGRYLQIHQGGQTSYPAFCRHCAETGVEKWTVDTAEMTCTYFDRGGNIMLREQIPVPAQKG